MQRILAGLHRFQRDVFPAKKALFESLCDGQAPYALFITCGDSRIVPSLLTQTPPGELFLSRQVGNIVPPHGTLYGGVSSTIEYAVGVLRVRHAIICGHTNCGAMTAILHPETVEDFPNTRRWLANAEVAPIGECTVPQWHGGRAHRDGDARERADPTHAPGDASRGGCGRGAGALQLHGWVYHWRPDR